MKTIAVIPALNEEKHIAGVVKRTARYVDTVIVADNGSQDKTRMMARNQGALVVTEPIRGLGHNLQLGLKTALYKEAEVIVLLDGDGQHNPEEIASLLQPILEDKADIVLGHRPVVRGYPPYRIFGNGLLAAVCNYRAKNQVKDPMIGFWAIRASCLPELTENGWGIYTELLIKARSNGYRLASIPVTPIYHANLKDNSTIHPLSQGMKLLWYIAKWRFICEVLKRG